MPVEIRMPQISMTMIDGTVVKWLKREGDHVAEGEDLVEIQTDKVVETLGSAASGIIARIVAKEDATIPVGELLCLVAREGETVPAPPQAPVAPQAAGAAEIRMPQISMTMIDGTIVKWLKREGDTVAEGDDLVEIQTDKVVETLGSAAAGTLLRIVAKEDETVPVGGLLCYVGEQGLQTGVPAATDGPAAAVSAPAPAAVPPTGQRSRRASPLAKKIAARKGVDLSGLKGTGPGGMIVKADVEDALKAAPPAPATPPATAAAPAARPPLSPDADDTVVPFEGIRKAIADNLMQSRRVVADVTTVADADMGAIKAMRKVLPISYTAFSILASARALAEFPVINALVEDDRIIMKKRINISVAVATGMGLMTPVIRDAGNKNLMTIADDLADLAARGRDGKLNARDFEGGTFTVSNSGVYGSILFTPIVNNPQSAILGLGRIAKVPVVLADDTIAPALMMYMSLSYNHRSIDGETAVKFLQRIRYYLEHPAEMLGYAKPA